MRKSFVALLLLLGAAASMTGLALAQSMEDRGPEAIKMSSVKTVKERLSRAARVGTAAIAGPGDTTWVGHTLAGTFNYGPWHVGKGPYTPGVSTDGVWDWDHFNAGENDSLQGWWPVVRQYTSNGGLTLSDDQRPAWCLDFGNIGNYVLNSQHQARTFGVLSYWHVDGGNNAPGPGGFVSWAPITGTGSAWCGLRIDSDNTYKDPITGNPYNSGVLLDQGENGGSSAAGSVGTSKHFPGYTHQMDQLLYRDITIASGATLSLSFNYRTAMSTTTDQTASTRAGWFQYDPSIVGQVAVTGPNFNAPNFISNTGLSQPADSFMVYVGVPTDIDNCYTADGTLHQPNVPVPGPTHGVYDLYRRWFSEVLALDKPITQLLSVGGTNAVTAFSNPSVSLSAIYNSQSGGTRYARIVFRVKTNAITSDLTGSGGSATSTYNSGGEGAVRLDDINVGGTGVTINSGVGNSPNPEGFEAAGDIDNTIEPGGRALSHWKATGKPPAIFFHNHPVAGGDIGGGNIYSALTYNDLCGPTTATTRFCNLKGVVISAGDHDHNEAAGGLVAGSAQRERTDGILSPVVFTSSSGAGDFNGEGIDDVIANFGDDYEIIYDLYAGIFNLNFTGNAWFYGIKAYPGREGNGYGGVKVWGDIRVPGFIIFNPDIQCFTDVEPYFANGIAVPVTGSRVPGVADSLRIMLGKTQQCFRFGVTGSNCSSTLGAYFDNVAVGFSNAAGSGGGGLQLSVDIWRWINDAFPINKNLYIAFSTPISVLDTASAKLQSGINIAQSTGDANRLDIPGDSAVAIGSSDNPARMDLVFRVKPGPGDYVIIGNRASGLRQVPTSTTAAVSGDGSWWGQYLADNGAFGTGGNGVTGPGHAGGVWSENIWNSARCDSVDVNRFGFATDVNFASGAANWEACYHESDPKYATLGISKNICFLNNPAGANNSTNITCSAVPTWATAGAGFDGNQQTKENTKILPDGIFVPGTHVEYFWRECEIANVGNFVMIPDTHFVSPQVGEGSTDAHRWQEFSVLPDRWKDGIFGDPTAHGMACMLYWDLNDRRGDERVWVSVADSIGATLSDKRGAHNGWKARGDEQYTDSGGNPIDISGTDMVVATHGGSPGTTWDMYGTKASESLTTGAGALGARFAPQGTGLTTGKDSKQGPTADMLQNYKVLFVLSGDLNSGVLGQFINRGQNDVSQLVNFLTADVAPGHPRVAYFGGDGFVQSEFQTGGVFSNHNTLLNDLGTSIKIFAGNPAYSYQPATNNFSQYVDMTTAGPIAGDIYSVGNACTFGNDILVTSGTGSASGFYAGHVQGFPNEQPISGVTNSGTTGSSTYTTYVDGWDIRHLYSRYGGSSIGRLGYYFHLLTTLQGLVSGCTIVGTPSVTLDVPGSGAKQYVDFMSVRNNPLVSGSATVHFGLARADRVQIRVYDVTGRLVRTLADRNFTAGEHDLVWDGSDNAGVQMARGVYFTQVRYMNSHFTDARKLTVLK